MKDKDEQFKLLLEQHKEVWDMLVVRYCEMKLNEYNETCASSSKWRDRLVFAVAIIVAAVAMKWGI